MKKLNIQKLAPLLSCKERAKILISNWQEEMAGKPILTDEEQKILVLSMAKNDLREFLRLTLIWKWSSILWLNEIEKLWLHISQILLETGYQKMINLIEQIFKKFSEYKEAISRLEKELDNMSLFDETTCIKIKRRFEFIEDLISRQNSFIENLFQQKQMPVQKNDYLIRKLTPERVAVNKLLESIQSLAENELRIFETALRSFEK